MPEILDAGTVQLSNAEVLNWIRDKRVQHQEEDDDDKKNKRPVTARPKNFLNSLNKHEAELADKKYPYVANPGAYQTEKNREDSLRSFDGKVTDEVLLGMRGDKYRGKGMTLEQIEATLGKEHDKMELTDTELLMIFNHAPQNVEMLQPMIESYDERFTSEELEKIVEIVQEVYRCGVALPGQSVGEDGQAEKKGATAQDSEEKAEDVMGDLETGMR